MIKPSQLMVLTPHISMNVEILSHSQDDHTRMRHWQANMDIQWKF
jgi:hypothetical protein